MVDREKEKLLAKIRELEDRYLSVTETSVDAIITTDSNDTILTWNKGAEIIFGYGPEIVGTPVTIIIPEKYREAHVEGVRRFLKTGIKHIIDKKVELKALKKDGTEFPVELSLSTWETPSGTYFGAIIRDISERKRTESIREDVQRMIRHDLRSPLIGITGLARMLFNSSRLTKKERKAAALIQELGEKTLGFINLSRDLFQMELGVYKLRPGRVNLVGMLNKIQEELGSLLSENEIKFMIFLAGKEINKGSEYPVEGEEDFLDLMFTNLIKNAIEASPRGSAVVVSIGTEQRGSKEYHVIDIHNSGVIPNDIREKFFDPYSTSGKEGGTGLGTHNALLIARSHGGDIRFETSEEKGTYVTVQLPF